mmetsp:Transcript_12825/g.36937  ORF Transcript_12825/g.36937 Transcript_12825/m.36937 type:complete len:299 (+) Transcript_12825:100-996(+)
MQRSGKNPNKGCPSALERIHANGLHRHHLVHRESNSLISGSTAKATGSKPCPSCAKGQAPASNKVSTSKRHAAPVRKSPPRGRNAMCKGVSPKLLTAFALAPCLNNSCMMFTSARRTASCKGVLPSASPRFGLGMAPALSRNSTTWQRSALRKKVVQVTANCNGYSHPRSKHWHRTLGSARPFSSNLTAGTCAWRIASCKAWSAVHGWCLCKATRNKGTERSSTAALMSSWISLCFAFEQGLSGVVMVITRDGVERDTFGTGEAMTYCRLVAELRVGLRLLTPPGDMQQDAECGVNAA